MELFCNFSASEYARWGIIAAQCDGDILDGLAKDGTWVSQHTR